MSEGEESSGTFYLSVNQSESDQEQALVDSIVQDLESDLAYESKIVENTKFIINHSIYKAIQSLPPHIANLTSDEFLSNLKQNDFERKYDIEIPINDPYGLVMPLRQFNVQTNECGLQVAADRASVGCGEHI